MVNSSGSFESDTDRNGKVRCTQPHEVPGTSQTATPATLDIAELCKTDLPHTVDNDLPSVVAAIERTPTKTTFGSNDDSSKSLSSESDEKASLCCSFPLEKVQGVLPSYTKSQRKLPCLFCDRSFVSSNLRQKHVERAHSVKRNRRVSGRRQNQLSAIPCVYCDKLNTSEHTLDDLFQHMVTEHPSKYYGCLPCQDRFLGLAHLEAHNSSKHQIKPTDYRRDAESIAPKLTRSRSKNKAEYSSNQEFKKPAGVKKKATSSIKEIRGKSFTLKTSKVVLKRSKRLQAQTKEVEPEKGKREKKVPINNKSELNSTKMHEKAKSNCINPYPEFDNFYRIKKITDHSIDNLKISSLTFDDVFDKAFFNRIKCNIEENLLHHIDGKLFKNEESESRISNFEKVSTMSQAMQNSTSENYGCELSLNAVTPVAALSLNSQFGEDFESQIEYGSKPSKKRTPIKNDEIHYKYFTRRKYQASILRQKENRDLSKLDMWTQLLIKERQQKMINEKKSTKEMLEYTEGDEYKSKIKREELNRILDRRGPFEDLKEEVCKKAAFDKLNSSSDSYVSEEIFSVVREVLNDILIKTFEDIEEEELPLNYIEKQIDSREIPGYLNLRQTSLLPTEGDIDKSDRIALICSSQETENFELPTNKVRGKDELVELTGEWARSRIYICGACGRRFPNLKYLLEHKSVHHQNVWVQHYEFVGNQSELYRHLSIPGLGKVGVVEDTVQCKQWKRSDARTCTKCGKQCNSLGELHRHILECAGDWTWLLARRKCKYKPFGAKSRRKRRGLVTQIHRKQKTEPSEKKSYKKSFDGPRQKPSDADTIQRMLANLPAKRLRRNIMSLQDVIFKTRKRKQNKTETKTNIKCGKTVAQGLVSEKKPTNTGTNTHQRQHATSNRRSLRSLNKVLASSILDSNAMLRVKRKIKSVNEKRITRQTLQVRSLDNSEFTSSGTDSQELEPSSSQNKKESKKSSQGNTASNDVKKLTRKKILTSRLNIKNFFPVKKRNNRSLLTKNDIQKQNITNFDVIIQNTVNFDQLGNGKNIAECPKVTSGGLKGLVRSLRKKTNSNELKVQCKSDSNLKSHKKSKSLESVREKQSAEEASKIKDANKQKEEMKPLSVQLLKPSTELKNPKKRKLNKSFQNVINKVRKLKIDLDIESKETNDNLIKKHETNHHGIFLEKTVSEEKADVPAQNFISLEIRSENLAKGSPVHVAENTIDSKENPPIPETIFNLKSKNEKSLQAKGELNFDKQIHESKPVSSEKKNTILPLTIETTEKSKTVPLVSPNIKGKIRKPNKGLNDCIAMLTSKLQQKEDKANLSTSCDINNPANSLKNEINVSEDKSLKMQLTKPECILRIPRFKVTPSIEQKETALDLTKKAFSAPNLFYNHLQNGLSTFGNTISKVIEGVIEHNCKEVFTKKLTSNWTSVDDIIQQVINNQDKKPECRKPSPKNFYVRNSVDETIESVVRGYQVSTDEISSNQGKSDESFDSPHTVIKGKNKPTNITNNKEISINLEAKSKSVNTNNSLQEFSISEDSAAPILSLIIKPDFHNTFQNKKSTDLPNGIKNIVNSSPKPILYIEEPANSQKPNNDALHVVDSDAKNSEVLKLLWAENKNDLISNKTTNITMDGDQKAKEEMVEENNLITNTCSILEGKCESVVQVNPSGEVNNPKIRRPKTTNQARFNNKLKSFEKVSKQRKPKNKCNPEQKSTSEINEIISVPKILSRDVANSVLSDSEDELPLALLVKQNEMNVSLLTEERDESPGFKLVNEDIDSVKEAPLQAEVEEFSNNVSQCSKENENSVSIEIRTNSLPKEQENFNKSLSPKVQRKKTKNSKKTSRVVKVKSHSTINSDIQAKLITLSDQMKNLETQDSLTLINQNSADEKSSINTIEANKNQIATNDKGDSQSATLPLETNIKQTTRRKSKSSKKIDKDENGLFKDFSLVINKKTKRIPPTNIVDDSVCDEILQSLSKPLEDSKASKSLEGQDDSVEEMDMEIEHIPFNPSIIERSCETEIASSKIFKHFDPTHVTEPNILSYNEAPFQNDILKMPLELEKDTSQISLTQKIKEDDVFAEVENPTESTIEIVDNACHKSQESSKLEENSHTAINYPDQEYQIETLTDIADNKNDNRSKELQITPKDEISSICGNNALLSVNTILNKIIENGSAINENSTQQLVKPEANVDTSQQNNLMQSALSISNPNSVIPMEVKVICKKLIIPKKTQQNSSSKFKSTAKSKDRIRRKGNRRAKSSLRRSSRSNNHGSMSEHCFNGELYENSERNHRRKSESNRHVNLKNNKNQNMTEIQETCLLSNEEIDSSITQISSSNTDEEKVHLPEENGEEQNSQLNISANKQIEINDAPDKETTETPEYEKSNPIQLTVEGPSNEEGIKPPEHKHPTTNVNSSLNESINVDISRVFEDEEMTSYSDKESLILEPTLKKNKGSNKSRKIKHSKGNSTQESIQDVHVHGENEKVQDLERQIVLQDDKMEEKAFKDDNLEQEEAFKDNNLEKVTQSLDLKPKDQDNGEGLASEISEHASMPKINNSENLDTLVGIASIQILDKDEFGVLKSQKQHSKTVAAFANVLKMSNVAKINSNEGNVFSKKNFDLNFFKNSLDNSRAKPTKHQSIFSTIEPLNEIISSSDMDIAPVIDEIDKSLEIDDIYDFSEEFEDNVNSCEKVNKSKSKTSDSVVRRTSSRSAKVKALENIHDGAIADLNEECVRVHLKSFQTVQKKTSGKLKSKKIHTEMLPNADFYQNTEVSDKLEISCSFGVSKNSSIDETKKTTALKTDPPHQIKELTKENSEQNNLNSVEFKTPKKSADLSSLVTITPEVEKSKYKVTQKESSDTEESKEVNENQELRRSRRGSQKVASYNENDLIDPLIEALENRRKGLKKHKSLDGGKNNDAKILANGFNSHFDRVEEMFKADKVFELAGNNTDNVDDSGNDCYKNRPVVEHIMESSSNSKTTASETSTISKNGKFKTPDKSVYCDICKKYFTRLESLIKHKGTLTHISKLSELEAKEAEMKAKLEKEKIESKIPDPVEVKTPDLKSDINITDILQQSENVCVLSPKAQTSYTNNETLKLADIISEVLNKPVVKPLADAAPEVSDPQKEFHHYKSLAERKSFDSNKEISDDSYYNQTLSKTTILEKQISLLENIIENQTGGINFMDNIFQSANNSHSEINSDFSSFVPAREMTVTQSVATNDLFVKPIQYEEISDDSLSMGTYEEQKSRKALNRDEELFLECCSLLKSSSEVSNFSKKCHVAGDNVKPPGRIDIFDSKNLVQTAEDAHEYSDNSRTPTPLGDTYDDEASNSDSISSNWNLRAGKKFEIGKNFTLKEMNNDLPDESNPNEALRLGMLGFKEMMHQFENVSHHSESDEQNEIETTPSEEIEQTDEKTPNDEYSSDHKKIITKGARKVFEGLKVSIPTEELDLAILTANQTTKKEEPNTNFENKEKSHRKSKPIKKPEMVSNLLFKSNRRKLSPLTDSMDDKHDVYDFEETQDNTEIFTKPDFRSFRNHKSDKKKDSDSDNDNDSPTYTDSIGAEAHSVSSASTFSVISSKKTDCPVENITKKKCMIMGRIFKNAAKSKVDEIDEEIRNIPEIPEMDNLELVENYVLSCSRVKTSPPPEEVKKTKMTEAEMDMLFDQLLGKKIPEANSVNKTPLPKSVNKNVETKKKAKQKNRKRVRQNSESSDDEFNINKTSKKRSIKKNGKEDNSINLEQELKECIGVASRKSQRKCTSGKQNVLVEYWSSDEEAFEALLESQKIQTKLEEVNTEVAVDIAIQELQTPKDCNMKSQTDVSHEQAPVVQKKKFTKKKLITCKKMSSDPFITPNRRKRIASNPLYHWSSSSEDESQALVEVTSRDEEDEEDRPIQHGWIVGDSPKKLVTMLALTKGKKTDIECVKEQNRKRNNTVS